MQGKIHIVKDTLTPQLQAAARKLSDRGPILRAMGETLVGLTKDAFKNPARRPSAWPPLKHRRDGTPLIRTRMLMTNIHVTSITPSSVTVTAAQDYGVHHQFGAPRAHIPPRPFFPFDSSGKMIPSAVEKIRAVVQAKLRALLPPA